MAHLSKTILTGLSWWSNMNVSQWQFKRKFDASRNFVRFKWVKCNLNQSSCNLPEPLRSVELVKFTRALVNVYTRLEIYPWSANKISCSNSPSLEWKFVELYFEGALAQMLVFWEGKSWIDQISKNGSQSSREKWYLDRSSFWRTYWSNGSFVGWKWNQELLSEGFLCTKASWNRMWYLDLTTV